MGYSDMESFIMEDCGGMLRDDKKLKAVIPGGSSVYIMNAGQILGKNVTLDYEGLVAAGSMLGTGGMMVMDETVDIMESTKNLTEFYKHESCGWCTPCREGNGLAGKDLRSNSVRWRKTRRRATHVGYL
jgi:NADH-quinone oxidoreductase subunit F